THRRYDELIAWLHPRTPAHPLSRSMMQYNEMPELSQVIGSRRAVWASAMDGRSPRLDVGKTEDARRVLATAWAAVGIAADGLETATAREGTADEKQATTTDESISMFVIKKIPPAMSLAELISAARGATGTSGAAAALKVYQSALEQSINDRVRSRKRVAEDA